MKLKFSANVSRELVAWYQQNAAQLPWRDDVTPYRIWLSEIMLQQTQVATVVPYFLHFVERFPTIDDLAKADQDTVLKMWEGLGYYSRARNLHKAAQYLVKQYGGEFPTDVIELQKLPGVGRYTAGAIASIAFDRAVPVLDGNVIRVFTRLFDIAEDVSLSETKKQLWRLAEDLIPSEQPGDYNQALMELGRTICKPRQALCAQCPMNAFCVAYQKGVQAQRPVKKKKKAVPHYEVTAGLVRNVEGKLLITKRPDDKMLGGLWEFPGGKQLPDESLPTCLKRELMEELGIQVQVGELFIKIRHAYSHFKITLYVFECVFLPEGGSPQAFECAKWRWVTEHELDEYAFSAADCRVIAELKIRHERLL